MWSRKVRNSYSSIRKIFSTSVLFDALKSHMKKMELNCSSGWKCLRLVARYLQAPDSGLNHIGSSVRPSIRMFKWCLNFFWNREVSCVGYVATHVVTKTRLLQNAPYQIISVSLKNLDLDHNYRLIRIHCIFYTRSCNIRPFIESHAIDFSYQLDFSIFLMSAMGWNFYKNFFSRV